MNKPALAWRRLPSSPLPPSDSDFASRDSALTRKFDSFVRLDAQDKRLLNDFCRQPRLAPAGQDLIREYERVEKTYVLLDGWGYRYKSLDNGKRQIISFLIPGDICDVYAFVSRKMDYSVGLLTDANVATSSLSNLWDLLWSSPRIGQAFFRSTIVDEGILRERLVSIARRNALERLSHFLCETWTRLEQVGLTADDTAPFPFTQEQLGDTLGLTAVHLNRTLQILRTRGLISLSHRTLRIHDPHELRQIAGFDASYLSVDEMV
ncbi:Crp/Fnr family transcriptional regulator [Sphingomonas sp. PL-96]|uniref:Crp/Fnr family transcriptional regulator n=1 Tax=Sphingomonas sp. PL-96 TaxID=2887201 RepID=UPI001E384680|nr:Crp/Fnr family transcriptional regulator [Sphingomonas sp. PL-96]MCC2977749.1 Crp/Fnr family transcriptional regulator [Sphingomonas sp. PL-96]